MTMLGVLKDSIGPKAYIRTCTYISTCMYFTDQHSNSPFWVILHTVTKRTQVWDCYPFMWQGKNNSEENVSSGKQARRQLPNMEGTKIQEAAWDMAKVKWLEKVCAAQRATTHSCLIQNSLAFQRPFADNLGPGQNPSFFCHQTLPLQGWGQNPQKSFWIHQKELITKENGIFIEKTPQSWQKDTKGKRKRAQTEEVREEQYKNI